MKAKFLIWSRKIKKDNSINIIGNPKIERQSYHLQLMELYPHDIATILDDDGVAIIRAGHHCCQILHDKLEYPSFS